MPLNSLFWFTLCPSHIVSEGQLFNRRMMTAVHEAIAHAQSSLLGRVLLVTLPSSWVLSNIMTFSLPYYFAFTPANAVLSHLFVWNVVTQLVVEMDVVSLVVSLTSVIVCVVPVERRLGTERVLLLVLAITLVSSVVMIALSALLFGLSRCFWLYQAFSGLAPASATCAVALSHLTRGADYVISSQLLSPVRTRHLPFGIVLYAFARDMWTRVLFPNARDIMDEMDIGSTHEVFEGPMLPMVLLSLFSTWALIRFYGIGWLHLSRSGSDGEVASGNNWDRNSGVAGDGPDIAPSFALHQFVYPGVLQRPFLLFSTAAFRILRVVGGGKEIEKAAQQVASSSADAARDAEYAALLPVALSTNGHSYTTSSGFASAGGVNFGSLAPLPGSTAADADRRRAVALAALTARLQQNQQLASKGSTTERGEHQGEVEDDAFSLNIRPADDSPALPQQIGANS